LKSQPILDLFNATQFYVKRQYANNGELLDGDPYWKTFGDQPMGKIFAYNILGRVAHLLGDMSVPAHVHEDEHSPLSPDKYENYMKDGKDNSKVTYWTAERIFEEKGDFINPYCSEIVGMSPVEYLMTITAQISDHFASNRKDGNDIIRDIPKSQYVIDEDINGHNTVSLPGPTTIVEYDASDDDDLDAIRDATFPFVIRATAGLLYWFLMETHQLDPDYRCRQFGYLIGKTLSGHDYMFREKKILVMGHDYWGPTIIETTAKNVVFKASQEIHFGPGFEARPGCEVSAFIGQCSDYELYE